MFLPPCGFRLEPREANLGKGSIPTLAKGFAPKGFSIALWGQGVDLRRQGGRTKGQRVLSAASPVPAKGKWKGQAHDTWGAKIEGRLCLEGSHTDSTTIV